MYLNYGPISGRSNDRCSSGGNCFAAWRLLCEDIEQDDAPPCWKIKDIVSSLRLLFKAQSAWALPWVPRRLNLQAHLLARWAAHFGFSGLRILVVCFFLFCRATVPLASFRFLMI